MEPDVTVVDNPDASRYEIRVDGKLAGFVVYRLPPDRIVFVHTEIDQAMEGRGLGGRLIRAALDDARAKGRKVTALCPFVGDYIERHPDYQDLLASPAGDAT